MRKGKPHHRDFVPEAAPLVQAAAEGDLPRARSLVKAGIPVSAFSNKSWGYYPIHVAAEKGHDKVVGFLLSSGANAETRTAAEFEQASDTPLLLACMNRHLKVVKVLVEAGADINGRDWLKNTPLGNAIKNDDAKLIAYLLEKGAKAEQVHLRLATGKGNLALMDLLVERGNTHGG